MLKIENLSVSRDDKTILHQISLSIPKGQTHVLMGPNGSGKSTLAMTLAGNPLYKILEGSLYYNGENIVSLTPDQRATRGIFLSFQSPVEISGINNMYFMRSSSNAILHAKCEPEYDPESFIKLIHEKAGTVGLPASLLQRNVNEGFSGGEKKINEILQMLILEPQFVILDEIDSGLDIDTLKIIANVISKAKSRETTFLIITHYPRLLEHLDVDKIYILQNGSITRTGDKTLLTQLEKEGYAGLESDQGG